MLRRAYVPAPKLRDREPGSISRIERAVSYSGTTTPAPKGERAQGGKAEHEHKQALAGLGCVLCRRLYGPHSPAPVELHHLRTGGWGKGDYTTLIPLCAEHHRGATGIHGLGTKGFVKRYGITQADLLMDAMTLLKETA